MRNEQKILKAMIFSVRIVSSTCLSTVLANFQYQPACNDQIEADISIDLRSWAQQTGKQTNLQTFLEQCRFDAN